MQRIDTLALSEQGLFHIFVYLVGNMNKWNNAKISEEKERVKHNAK